jgi:hypothetical protein
MAKQLARRVLALEAGISALRPASVWRNKGQTVKQAVPGEFPDGVPLGVDVTVIGWLEAAETDARNGAEAVYPDA